MVIGGVNECPEYHARPSKSAHARHVPLPRIRGRFRDPGISGVYQRLRTVPAQRGCWRPTERASAIHRSHPGDSAADRIQIRKAPALPLRFPGVAHEATSLLRHGAGFSAESDVPEGGPTRMPLTMRQHEASLHQPAFCELLPIRDYLDNVIVRSSGALVAGYDLGGINSYYHSDETRNQTKRSLEALVRSLTERSMRMQVRFEVTEGLGELPARYRDQLRSDNPVVQRLDRVRLAAWKQKEQSGFYLTPMLHAYLYWDPRIHHEAPEAGVGKKLGNVTGGWSPSAAKCIQRTRREHEDLLAEFESMLKGV